MGKLEEFVDNLDAKNQISLMDVPEIDLYMDQVIQLFENKFKDTKRNDDEKILTKTMINNYAKAKLFFPIKNKKYSKEHLLLISLIYQLKGALSINDIKETFRGINKSIIEDKSFLLDEFYNSYLQLTNNNVANFREDLEARIQEVDAKVENLKCDDPKYIQRVLLISSLVNISNLYRRAAEKLVDEIVEKEEGKKETK